MSAPKAFNPSGQIRRTLPERLWCGLLSVMGYPWLTTLVRDRWLCRILAAFPLPLVMLPLLGWSWWPCPFHRLTGLPCPGCGMTRAAVALVRGNLTEAMGWHPFILFTALIWLTLAAGAVLPETSRTSLVSRLGVIERWRLSGLLLAAFLGFGLGRMIITGWRLYHG